MDSSLQTHAQAPAVVKAADRLAEAARNRTPCEPVREFIGADDFDLAYAVQMVGADRRAAAGAKIVGRKIGLTSEAVQKQLGVDRPDFGVLFDDMRYDNGASIPINRLLQPKIEAEIAFVIGRTIDTKGLATHDLLTYIKSAVAALEIVDSRIKDWDISFADTVADNASSGLFVLGREHVGPDTFVPATAEMSMFCNGAEVSSGRGADCLGDPLNALSWLADLAIERGEPLQHGQIVLSGALGPMVPARRNDKFTAQIAGLGSVTTTFA
jgi:2-keto-4-pentenoate hydratase